MMMTLADMRRLWSALLALQAHLRSRMVNKAVHPPTAKPVPADVRRWWSALRATSTKRNDVLSGRYTRTRMYDDLQLQAVEKSLALVGVSVDTVFDTLGAMCTEWRGLQLRDVLHELAYRFIVVEAFPYIDGAPKSEIARLRKGVKTLKAARSELIEDYILARVSEARDVSLDLGFDADAVKAACATLGNVIKFRQSLIGEIGDCRGREENARTLHNDFWRQLLLIWRAIVPERVAHEQHHLCEFLFACSTPFYPDVTTYEKLTTFVERHPRKSRKRN
jgi:hypothetical protein